MSRIIPHLLTGAEFSAQDLLQLLQTAQEIKQNKAAYANCLQHKHLALLFEKPSLRTRLSFTVAMQQLGGQVVESVSHSRKDEEPEDQMRVLQGYCDAVMVRTFSDTILQRMQKVATIPLINGLSDQFHPCQILADLLTLQEKLTELAGLHLCYLGDGNNILNTLLIMAPLLGVHIHYCTPQGHEPSPTLLDQAMQRGGKGSIQAFTNPEAAVSGCHAVYTDVWTSMGFAPSDDRLFEGFQVNEQLMMQAHHEAIFLHCMPMERGKEVSQTLPDHPCSAIFQQSENRLHVQKAVLLNLLT